jgi:hypothetical protein
MFFSSVSISVHPWFEFPWPIISHAGSIPQHACFAMQIRQLLRRTIHWAKGPTDRSLWQRHRNRDAKEIKGLKARSIQNIHTSWIGPSALNLFSASFPWALPKATMARAVGADGTLPGFDAAFSRVRSRIRLPVLDASKEGFRFQDSVVRIWESARRQKRVVGIAKKSP